MRRFLLILFMLGAASPALLRGQINGAQIPPAALAAHTVAIVNETHNEDVEKGAEAAIRDWGKLRLVDDPDTADVTLHFDKTREHDGESSHKTDADGNPTDYSYSVSFSSKIHMHAYLKNGYTPFYSTTTDDSKRKAGVSCVDDLRSAYRAAHGH